MVALHVATAVALLGHYRRDWQAIGGGFLCPVRILNVMAHFCEIWRYSVVGRGAYRCPEPGRLSGVEPGAVGVDLVVDE